MLKAGNFLLLFMLVALGCNQEFTPKPRSYFRIDLPQKEYRIYNDSICPFEFEYPVYAQINKEKTSFDEDMDTDCWINLVFPSLHGKIYFSYKYIDDKEMMVKVIDDSHKMTFKHSIKADYIDETEINTVNHVKGILYEVGGNAASNVQFFVTDTSHHYLRGALYFNAPPNIDSIKPVLDFVKADMLHLIETLKWRNQ